MPQSWLDRTTQTLRSLFLMGLLYPLERLQTIKQVRHTYVASQVSKNSPAALATHHGIIAQFRGLSPFVVRTSLIAFATQGAHLLKERGESQHGSLLTMGLATLAYTLVYPLEMAGIRMCTELERFRFYSNTRRTFNHIRKNEGIRTVFRGLPYAYCLFAVQLGVTYHANEHISSLIQQSKSDWQPGLGLLGSWLVGEIFIYPFHTLKKVYQVSGAMGHNHFPSLLTALRLTKLAQLFGGLQVRLAALTAYSFLFSLTQLPPQQSF